MTEKQLEALCEAARKRIADWAARSAGQHKRAMRKAVNSDLSTNQKENHVLNA